MHICMYVSSVCDSLCLYLYPMNTLTPSATSTITTITSPLQLFMKLDTSLGGFSYGTHEIGAVLSIAGAMFTCFTLTLLPIVANFDKSRLYFWGK